MPTIPIRPASFVYAKGPGRPQGKRPRKATPPATVAEYVSDALAAPTSPPPPLPPLQPKDPNRRRGSIWSSMTATERTAHARKLAALRDPSNMKRDSRKGVARGWSAEAFAVAKAQAQMEAAELVKRLKLAGLIAHDDQAGADATLAALAFVRTPGSRIEREKVARRLLRFYASPELANLI